MASAALLLFLPVLLAQDPTVRDFKRYYPRAKDLYERVEYVKALKGIDDAGVADALLQFNVLRDPDPHIAAAGREVLAALPSEAARASMQVIVEKGKPPENLAGIIRAAGEGKWVEYTPLLRPHLASKSEEVRLWTATSLGLLGDVESLPAFAQLAISDALPLVRVAAVDALGALGKGHEDVAGPPLAAAVQDAALEVQTAACMALRQVRVKEAIGPLVALMEQGEGRILEQVYPTLVAITDMQFRDDPASWRNWWKQAEASYVVPSDEELAKRQAARAKAAEQYVPSQKSASFMGVDTPSTSIVFVIDVSGSMEEDVTEKDGFRERGFTRFSKLEITKEELARTIEGLGSNVRFNIIAFATQVYPWRPKLVPANPLTLRSAKDFVQGLQPIGGQLAAARASAGLKGSAGADEGRTNTYAGLLAGLGIEIKDNQARTPVTGNDTEIPSDVDTVFFLSDGRPSVGELVEPDDIVDAVTELNRFRRVTLHTIAIGGFEKDFMEELARRNGGLFVDLGR
ncbi:MAG: hypothetical protein EYC70_05035 [Planctomycetota bacterium]|nr:MAG: hypothetical protein EYC70_05035 [Planctomycetota bacterium]